MSTGSAALMNGPASSALVEDKAGGSQCFPRSSLEGRMSQRVVILEGTVSLELSCGTSRQEESLRQLGMLAREEPAVPRDHGKLIGTGVYAESLSLGVF